MLADIRYWENDATNKHYAIAHFNVWNAEMLMGVIDAAEEAKSPVIISFGTGFVGNTSFEEKFLSLQTGEGKTFCALKSVIDRELVPMIFVNNNKRDIIKGVIKISD